MSAFITYHFFSKLTLALSSIGSVERIIMNSGPLNHYQGHQQPAQPVNKIRRTPGKTLNVNFFNGTDLILSELQYKIRQIISTIDIVTVACLAVRFVQPLSSLTGYGSQ